MVYRQNDASKFGVNNTVFLNTNILSGPDPLIV